MEISENKSILKRFIAIPVYCVLLVLLYNQALVYLFSQWRREDFNYAYGILPIVLYLIWEKRNDLRRIPFVVSWEALLPIFFGIGLYSLGELGGEYTIIYISLWIVVVGLCWLHIGWKKLKVIAFPLAFSLVMIPPPTLIYGNISLKLKLISSRIGVLMLQLLGMSAFREGNIIDLGFTKLQVVDACSGLRYLVPLIALGFLIAYHYRFSLWKGAVIVLSAIPVTIITNSLRLASVGILYPIWGQKVAEGFFHDFSGWLIFMVSLVVLLAEVWLLNRLFPEERKEPALAGGGKIDIGEIPIDGENVARQGIAGLLGPPQSIVAILLLAATLAVFQGVNFREKVPLGRPLAEFPLAVGDWRGVRGAMEKKFLDSLKLSGYSLIDFKDPAGKEVNFYVAYHESQRKGESSHSPDSCLPGSGWIFQDSGLVPLSVQDGNGKPMRVSRAVMQKSGERQISYYWFPQRGRVLTNMYQLKIYAFWDALTRQRTDGALVRLITPVYESEKLTDAEARLQSFAREIVPILDGYIPGKDRT